MYVLYREHIVIHPVQMGREKHNLRVVIKKRRGKSKLMWRTSGAISE